MARRALLLCGVLSSVLYVATDVIGGLRYPGYSFTSHTISELAAIGAPTKSFAGPLFSMYSVLALPFAVGVLWEAAGRNHALRVTGALLLGYVVFGWVGFSSSPIHQRGAGALASDLPHVVVAGVVVLLLLLTIGVGAFALGKRFRIYSFATLLTMLVSSVLTFSYTARIAANRPTPGVGIFERIDVYAPMLWLAVLAIALLRGPHSAHTAGTPEIHGAEAPSSIHRLRGHMRPVHALKIILGLSLFGVAFSGALTYRELFGVTALSCPAPGAPGTVFGYPACVYGFFMYVAITTVAALGLRGIHTEPNVMSVEE